MDFIPGMKLRLVQFIIGFAQDRDGLRQPTYVPVGMIVKVQSVDDEIALALTSDGVELDLYPHSRVELVQVK